MNKYRTTSPQKAAALLAQKEQPIHYEGLEPTNIPGRYSVILSFTCDRTELDEISKSYDNESLLVEPIRYDQKVKTIFYHIKTQQGQI